MLEVWQDLISLGRAEPSRLRICGVCCLPSHRMPQLEQPLEPAVFCLLRSMKTRATQRTQ